MTGTAKVNFFITKDGILKRKQNTVYFINKEVKRILPIEKIYTIYAHGRISFSSGVVAYLSKYGVPIHFFGKYGNYEGSFYPKETLLSGEVLVKQAQHYLDNVKRFELAKEIISGMADNIKLNLQYYERNEKNLSEEIAKIEMLSQKISEYETINELMAIEGNIWSNYYQSFSKFLPEKFELGERTRRPPNNMLNCMISFGNSLLYGSIITEIYNTQLNPTISFLHEPSERRFSLALDISEIFKPLIVDRIIFKLINLKMINENDFVQEMNSCLLNENGKKLFLKEYDEKLKTTIKHRTLKKNVSYQRLIRLECYKIIKHLIGMKKYSAFRMWW
ncbi:MAG: type I-B CRISPR-associated endonuclease Cas1b [Candidatus Pacearchaeota archaeon]